MKIVCLHLTHSGMLGGFLCLYQRQPLLLGVTSKSSSMNNSSPRNSLMMCLLDGRVCLCYPQRQSSSSLERGLLQVGLSTRMKSRKMFHFRCQRKTLKSSKENRDLHQRPKGKKTSGLSVDQEMDIKLLSALRDSNV